MFELTLLLLPVAAASGWLAARRSLGKREQSPARDLTPAYFQGLNHLLNEQPDKAIDVFIKMLEVDSDTVETHLALGNLFRRRGEVDRAIRIHQNLIARPTLNREQRAQALLELGQDYMRAGLFDRAENLFVELSETRLYEQQALTNLLEIYQQEKDWQRCLEITERLPGDALLKMQMSHFYCELAEGELKLHNLDAAERYLKKAQAVDRQGVRATILQGNMERDRGECQAAIKTYKRVEQQDANYLSEMIDGLVGCYRTLGREKELGDYLSALYHRQHSPVVMLALADILSQEEGVEATAAFVLDHLASYPDLRVLEYLVRLNQRRQEHDPRETLKVLGLALDRLLTVQPKYRCEQCGFTAKTLHWHCPSCRRWNSIKPVQGLGCQSEPTGYGYK